MTSHLRDDTLRGGEFTVLAVQSTEMDILRDRTELLGQVDSPLGPIFRVGLSGQSSWKAEGFLIGLDGVGRLDAALRIIGALDLVDTRRIYVVGIIGGFEQRNVALGDVIIADQIIDYEMQRLAEQGPEYRARVYSLDKEMLDDCRAVIRRIHQEDVARCSEDQYPAIRYHVGAVFSGDKVIASSSAAASLLELHPAAVGVEMEGAGVAAALASRQNLKSLCMVRGVADVANERKRDDARQWQKTACERAADFTIRLIRESSNAV